LADAATFDGESVNPAHGHFVEDTFHVGVFGEMFGDL
jgi:hypothetical protein